MHIICFFFFLFIHDSPDFFFHWSIRMKKGKKILKLNTVQHWMWVQSNLHYAYCAIVVHNKLHRVGVFFFYYIFCVHLGNVQCHWTLNIIIIISVYFAINVCISHWTTWKQSLIEFRERKLNERVCVYVFVTKLHMAVFAIELKLDVRVRWLVTCLICGICARVKSGMPCWMSAI